MQFFLSSSFFCLLFFALFYYSLLFLKFERGVATPVTPPLDPPMYLHFICHFGLIAGWTLMAIAPWSGCFGNIWEVMGQRWLGVKKARTTNSKIGPVDLSKHENIEYNYLKEYWFSKWIPADMTSLLNSVIITEIQLSWWIMQNWYVTFS